jgi:hypothetical protein
MVYLKRGISGISSAGKYSMCSIFLPSSKGRILFKKLMSK